MLNNLKLLTASLIFYFSFSYSVYATEDNIYQKIGITSLMQAVADNDLESVIFYSRINPKNINKINIGGASALHIAVRNKNIKVVNHLIKKGANVNAKDNQGYTPIMRAARYNLPKIFYILKSASADLSKLNNNSESVIILSALSSCNKCLSISLLDQNSIKKFNNYILKSQIAKSYNIAKNLDNQFQTKLLSDFSASYFKNKQSDKNNKVSYKFNGKKYKSFINDKTSKTYILKTISDDKSKNYRDEFNIKFILKKPVNLNYKKKYKNRSNSGNNLKIKQYSDKNEVIILDGKNINSQSRIESIVQDNRGEIKKTFVID